MKILSENTTLDLHAPHAARRVASIAVGLLLGITLCLSGVHATRVPDPAAAKVSTEQNAANPAAQDQKGWHQIGLASWYGPQFQGRETANGETYNMNALTCAHRFLPLGTWVKVTNLHTDKWIVVRVNDRGPLPDTRIVDLSSAAAYMLGIRNRGVTRIRLDVIDPKQAVKIAKLDKLRLARMAAAADAAQTADPSDPVEAGN